MEHKHYAAVSDGGQENRGWPECNMPLDAHKIRGDPKSRAQRPQLTRVEYALEVRQECVDVAGFKQPVKRASRHTRIKSIVADAGYDSESITPSLEMNSPFKRFKVGVFSKRPDPFDLIAPQRGLTPLICSMRRSFNSFGLHRHWFPKSDAVSFRVFEPGEPSHPGNFLSGYQGTAAQFFSVCQSRLDIVDLSIDGHVLVRRVA